LDSTSKNLEAGMLAVDDFEVAAAQFLERDEFSLNRFGIPKSAQF
jgi:hypothetical protein